MLVYTHTITPRLEYIFDLLLKEMIGVDVQFTHDTNYFNQATVPKLVYSSHRLQDGIFIQADPLLFETGIRKLSIEVFDYRNMPAFFQGEGHLPFDIFAASFYLVSRYEEYLPSRRDSYGRYQAKHSLAGKHRFLDMPLINLWVEELRKLIAGHYPSVALKEPQFSATITFDIDVAYAYRGRTLTRSILSAGKDFLSFNFSSVINRLKVLTKKTTDPYDTYSYIKTSLSKDNINHVFFFLLANKLTKYDRNISRHAPVMTSLVKELDAFSEVGIHPSYYSTEDKNLLKEEKQLLEQLVQHPVTISRQHYLRFQLPGTFMEIIEAGISDDYSMGYAETPGFRASICSSFLFYNLQDEQVTTLRMHPVSYMEGSFIEDMAMQPGESISMIENLIKAVKAVKGAFICIWHNHTLSEQKPYEGWRESYEATLRLIKERE